jgi:POT family proton-dependent oligopeptide transporter
MAKVIDFSDSDIEQSKKITKLPNFLKLLFFVEMWERFSYYGMRGLLVIFLTSQLGFKDERAYAIYSVFAAIGYAGPVLAGLLADKLVGFRNMILSGGILITLGHATMSLIELKSDLIYVGLALIAVGTGMFKGNITNLLGACYASHDPERSRGLTLFYVAF